MLLPLNKSSLTHRLDPSNKRQDDRPPPPTKETQMLDARNPTYPSPHPPTPKDQTAKARSPQVGFFQLIPCRAGRSSCRKCHGVQSMSQWRLRAGLGLRRVLKSGKKNNLWPGNILRSLALTVIKSFSSCHSLGILVFRLGLGFGVHGLGC